MNNNKRKPRRFRLLNPEQWGLNPSKVFIAFETNKGFAIRIGQNDWIGLPKSHVLRNSPGIFRPLSDGSYKSR